MKNTPSLGPILKMGIFLERSHGSGGGEARFGGWWWVVVVVKHRLVGGGDEWWWFPIPIPFSCSLS
jgi:hypothetical protein